MCDRINIISLCTGIGLQHYLMLIQVSLFTHLTVKLFQNNYTVYGL